MRGFRITGVLLILLSAYLLFSIFAFATLATGGLEADSPEWWPTVLGAVFKAPETYICMAAMMAGVGLCLHRPGIRMTVRRLMTFTGIGAVLLGLFLRAATRERQWSESRTANPDGTRHLVKQYGNWFGPTRTVEADEP